MPDRSIKGILELFERQAEDELNLLSDTGPEFFTEKCLGPSEGKSNWMKQVIET